MYRPHESSPQFTRRGALGIIGAAVAGALLPRRRRASSLGRSAPTTVPPANPYLVGNFAPIDHEYTATRLSVTGTIPDALKGGTLLRIGPNPVVVADPSAYHWFLGDGMVHGFTFGENTVDARNLWVRTDQASAALGEQPIAGQPADVLPLNPANTSIVDHGGHILALLEVGLPTEIDRECGTIGRFDFAGSLTSAMTAHPKLDPRTGEMVFFGMSISGPPFLRYHVADARGSITSRDIEVQRATMMHDFAVSERTAVFFDCPVVYGAPGTGNFPAAWQPSVGTRVGVLPRNGGDIAWIDIDPCFASHIMNAYDDDDEVVVDLVTYPVWFDDSMPFGPSGQVATLERWWIDAARGIVSRETIDKRGQEFPRVDPRLAGHKHRYGYTTETLPTDDALSFGTMLKQDMLTGERRAARLPGGAAASEAIFVPDSPTAGEDEGWLVATVFRPETDTSDIVIVDAQAMGDPVATIALRHRVPFGFHGTWVPAG
jgi:carotenoid cleavage dioxygenase-like enzyme